MKKILFFAAASMVLFASCRKNRLCVCNDNYGDTYTYTIVLKTKKDAQVICDSYSDPGYSTCSLN